MTQITQVWETQGGKVARASFDNKKQGRFVGGRYVSRKDQNRQLKNGTYSTHNGGPFKGDEDQGNPEGKKMSTL